METVRLKITDARLKYIDSTISRISDTELSGFHVRVGKENTIGKRPAKFYLYYRLGGRSGKAANYLIGKVNEISVEEARREAKRLLGRIAEGEDISQTKKSQVTRSLEEHNSPTLNDLLNAFEKNVSIHRKQPEEVTRIFNKDIRPSIGKVKLFELTGMIVKRKCLDLIRDGKSPTSSSKNDSTQKRIKPAPNQALKTERLLKQVFEYGLSESWLSINPLAQSKSKYSGAKSQPRERNLSESEIQYFFSWLNRQSTASIQVKECYKLLLLTGCRSKEMTLSEWSHIDYENRMWLFPAKNRKGRAEGQKGASKDHIVPLTNQMLESLEKLKVAFSEISSPYIFPSTSGNVGKTPIDRAAPAKYLKRRFNKKELDMAEFVPHDFRRTFCSRMADRGYDIYILDQCIGHQLPTEMMRHYQQSDFMERRIEVMKAWSQVLQELWRVH